jgi:hypothetical protein
MNVSTKAVLATALISALSGSPLEAQVLHVNDRWKDCAFLFAPSLTQASFRQFVGELGQVTYFRPLASARPMGARNIEFTAVNWSTAIDGADDAWNDTFSHPDGTHHLVRGPALEVPGFMFRGGVTDRADVGVYFTKALEANWGLAGAHVQYSLVNDAERNLAAAGRASVTRLFGPDDLSMSVYGVELVASRDVSVFSPYAGVSGYFARGAERSSVVKLANENVFGIQAMAGVAVNVSVLRVGVEANVAKVPGYSLKVGLGF